MRLFTILIVILKYDIKQEIIKSVEETFSITVNIPPLLIYTFCIVCIYIYTHIYDRWEEYQKNHQHVCYINLGYMHTENYTRIVKIHFITKANMIVRDYNIILYPVRRKT